MPYSERMTVPANQAVMDPFRDFNRSEGPSLGVEWEIALVDPETRDLVPYAAEVIEAVEQRWPETHLEKEFLKNTIELVTPVCQTTAEAMDYLRAVSYTHLTLPTKA